MQINLTATSNLPADPNQNLLFFLLPKYASENFQVEAWRKLNPGPNGGQSSMTFDMTTQVCAYYSDAPNWTAITPVLPGQVLGAYSDGVNALRLGLSPNDNDRVTNTQSGLVNHTNGLLITSDWYVNGTEVVRIANVNQEQIVTFELESTIYVMAAAPTIQGRVGSFNFTVQEVSNLTSYVIPPGVTDIQLSWSRVGGGMGGADVFSFNPSSYAVPA
jgi:hypothetical protein